MATTSMSPAPRAIPDETPRNRHLCPWWVGYLLASPLRKLGENPEAMLGPLVEPGMTAVDIGCGMGFFSLPLARMVGERGRVVCVDVQPRMLSTLQRRARRRGLGHIIETHLAAQEDLGLEHLQGQADLVLAIHVVHEATYPQSFLAQARDLLRPGGTMMLLEPKGHVTETEFAATRDLALELGLEQREHQLLKGSRLLVLDRPAA